MKREFGDHSEETELDLTEAKLNGCASRLSYKYSLGILPLVNNLARKLTAKKTSNKLRIYKLVQLFPKA